jgi:hypothetical protein
MLRRVFPLVLGVLLSFSVLSCSTQRLAPETSGAVNTKPSSSSIVVAVTMDFGKELVVEREVAIDSGMNAMDALRMIADVRTEYGGGFVSSINGVASDKKKDWFFYINGICANVGARDYILHPDDVVHWDFRDWSYQQFVSAIIGDFPQPFRNGYAGKTAPTLVVYEAPFVSEAESLVSILKDNGVSQVSAIACDQLSADSKRHSNLIVIAGAHNNLISELNNLHRKLGFYTRIQGEQLYVLDAAGNVASEYHGLWGLLQATQNPWNPKGTGACENVALMVTGSNDENVRHAANALLSGAQELRYAFAAVIANSTVFKVP